MSHGNDSTEQVSTGSNVYVQSLLNAGFRWNTFDQTGDSNEIRYTFAGGGFTPDQEAQADAALTEWSNVSGITFTKVEDDVLIRFPAD